MTVRSNPWFRRLALLCVFALALVAVLEATHFHENRGADKSCTLCVAVHHGAAAKPAAVQVAPRPIVVISRAGVLQFEPHSSLLGSDLFSRPPPAV